MCMIKGINDELIEEQIVNVEEDLSLFIYECVGNCMCIIKCLVMF